MTIRLNKKFLIIALSNLLILTIIITFILKKIKRNNTVKQQYLEIHGLIKPNDSIYKILKTNNIKENEIAIFLAQYNNLRKMNKFNLIIKSDDEYSIFLSTDNIITSFILKQDIIKTHIFKRIGMYNFSYEYLEENLTQKIYGVSGYINTNLYTAFKQKGLSDQLIFNFADKIFAWEIDFMTEPRTGDKFSIIWEVNYLKDKKYSDGDILFAQYSGKETGEHLGILYTDKNGNKNYYDQNGNSLTKQFLKAPLNYKRISSYFTYKRFHPILRYVRPHLGIDYSAPLGTPVSTIGDGIVIFAGWKGDYGKAVIIRHNSTYVSYYGHLSRIEKNIKNGIKVKQGQVIGYVGSTGLSTGPHLDFRISKNGTFVNFLSLKFPPNNSIANSEKELFISTKEKYLKLLPQINEDIKEIKF